MKTRSFSRHFRANAEFSLSLRTISARSFKQPVRTYETIPGMNSKTAMFFGCFDDLVAI